MRIAFCHPDLGIGGAERFIVDVADELQQAGHTVHIYTSHYDVSRCFEETKQMQILLAATWLPRNIFGLAAATCAYLRMMVVALTLCWRAWSKQEAYDCVIVDQVSAVIPILKRFSAAKVVFYGHYPDMLLAKRGSALRRAYRTPLDWLEGRSTACADKVLVNSQFTRKAYAATFPQLSASHTDLQVVYPAVRILLDAELQADAASWHTGLEQDLVNWMRGGDVFLSINRFERKKGIELAICSLKEVIDRHALSSGACARCRLIVCGGYDPRVTENVEHFAELQELAAELGVDSRVVFLKNVTETERRWLLAACKCVVYTPQNEHFGIVPIEAMAAGRPVIACNSGGPTESILNNNTGLLSEPTTIEFANAMVKMVLQDKAAAAAMAKAARQRVHDMFSRKVLGQQLQAVLREVVGGRHEE